MTALSNVITHRELIENLVVRDIKARYKQSMLGITWTILNPLMMALIYTLIAVYFFKYKTEFPFPIFAYFGLLFWNTFAAGVTGATESLVTHLNLITKIYFPREVFPLAAVLGKFIDFLFGLAGLVFLLLIYRTSISTTSLLILPLLLIQCLFTVGIGMLFACANLFYRDVRHVIGLLLYLWMFLVPNLYPLEQVPTGARSLYLMNPMATIVEAARRLAFPQLGPVPWGHVGIAAAASIITFAVGYMVFKYYEPLFAESV